jgi:hypothetical protein
MFPFEIPYLRRRDDNKGKCSEEELSELTVSELHLLKPVSGSFLTCKAKVRR